MADDSALTIEPADLAKRCRDGEALVVLDVREPWEFEICHIQGAQLIPLGRLQAESGTLPKDRPVVAVCHHGMRSMQATNWLRQNGFKAINLTGGIDRWAAQIDPDMPRY